MENNNMTNKEVFMYSMGMTLLLLVVIPLTDISVDNGNVVDNDVNNERVREATLVDNGEINNLMAQASVPVSENSNTALGSEQDNVVENSNNSNNNALENNIIEEGNTEETEELGDNINSFGEIKRVVDVPRASCSARSCLVHSLDDDIPLFYDNTSVDHQIASITKLMTAIIVRENLSPEENILITPEAVNSTRTVAGNLVEGEEYNVEDLLKLMLITSSNVAAHTFEDHFGGRDEFTGLMNSKALAVGMEDTYFEDSSGISNFNTATAKDVLKLVDYIINNHPDILHWTSLEGGVFYPSSSQRLNEITNIVPLAFSRNDYVGGKTGTTDIAGQNLVAVFEIEGNERSMNVVFLVFRSEDRYRDILELVDWVNEAYVF